MALSSPVLTLVRDPQTVKFASVLALCRSSWYTCPLLDVSKRAECFVRMSLWCFVLVRLISVCEKHGSGSVTGVKSPCVVVRMWSSYSDWTTWIKFNHSENSTADWFNDTGIRGLRWVKQAGPEHTDEHRWKWFCGNCVALERSKGLHRFFVYSLRLIVDYSWESCWNGPSIDQ